MSFAPTWSCVGEHTTATCAAGVLRVCYNPSAAGYGSVVIDLPSRIDFRKFPYLNLKVRASREGTYFIRPYRSGEVASTPPHGTPLTLRRGMGVAHENGWEIPAFNLLSYYNRYDQGVPVADRIECGVSTDPNRPMQVPTPLTLELDWAAVSSGLLPEPDRREKQETHFGDGLDNDGDGAVDRDDDQFRRLQPGVVLANYHTVFSAIYNAGFRGTRDPIAGEQGQPIAIDPNSFAPGIRGKRLVRSTFYPLDYRASPLYEARNYDEFADRDPMGRWNPCAAACCPPTQQSPSLDYATLGGLEEYDVSDARWVGVQADLARRAGIDAFVYNDAGLNERLGTEDPLQVMGRVLTEKSRGAWREKPLRFVSFYNALPEPTLRNSADMIVKDLAYIIRARPGQIGPYLRVNGKPVVFVYPCRVQENDPLAVPIDEWRKVIGGLADAKSTCFDGLLNMDDAKPDTSNVLTLEFDCWRTDLWGGPLSGQLRRVAWLDADMRPVNTVDCGTTATRDSGVLLSGFGADVESTIPLNFAYTQIQQRDETTTPGQARLATFVPSRAAYLQLTLLGWGTHQALGRGRQQHCSVRLGDGARKPGLQFPTRLGWCDYVFRLEQLPAGFSGAAFAPPKATLWGELADLVVRTDDAYSKNVSFDGYASYPSHFADSRVEVSNPFLHADTVRPGFDESGNRYWCSSTTPYFYPRRRGDTYRHEWEKAIRDRADMVIITSWNEWGEGTNIEPDIEHGFLYPHLTLTYSLIYHGIMETRRSPSATGLIVTRCDPDGDSRVLEFSLTGPDVITFRPPRQGAGCVISQVGRNGQYLALQSEGTRRELCLSRAADAAAIRVPAVTSHYRLQWNCSR